jgi:glycosyltransferase involved in cell wall biosynthesis
MNQPSGISIFIPVYNGGKLFSQCLEQIDQQTYPGTVQLIIVDSGSTDGTVELAKRCGATIEIIDKHSFHHARTRNKAVSLANFDHVVLMVQDAIPCSNKWLAELQQTLLENDVVAAYIGHVPHDDADCYARAEVDFHRAYLGLEARVQQIDSPETFQKISYLEALKTVRLDNVCAIYQKKALINEAFPDVPFAEDLAWALKNLMAGKKIMYQPRINVKHSHNRSPDYRLKRAVVETISCAKILNRTRHDLSFLKFDDLPILTSKIQDMTRSLKKNLILEFSRRECQRLSSRNVFIKTAYEQFVPAKVKNVIARRISTHQLFRSVIIKQVVQTVLNDIRQHWLMVKRQYPQTTTQELGEVIDHITASYLGALYGGVYASHMLNGSISRELEEFVQPYLSGV